MSKPRPKFDERLARQEGEDAARWLCASCPTMIEPEQPGPFCRNCASYWEDVENGIFER